MALITYTDKDDTQPTSDQRRRWTDDDANEVKVVVNTNRSDSDSSIASLTGAISATNSNLSLHTGDTSNPHDVTKTQVGLSDVDNTSDVNKPVSTAQAAAINAKVADAITDGITTVAPSQNAVFDALALKQDALVSATNIKTVNGNSILGSGDIDLIDDAIVNGVTTKAPSQNAVYDALLLKANSGDVPPLISFVDGDVPSGLMDSSNTEFTLSFSPISGSVKVFWNGMKLRVGVGYTIAGATIELTIPPDASDTLECDYRK